MTEVREDMQGVGLFCRFGDARYLAEMVRNRLPLFVSFVEEAAAGMGDTVLWTDQPGGFVSDRKFALDSDHCAELADAVGRHNNFNFLAWAPWRASRSTPAIHIARHPSSGDSGVITLEFPPHRFCGGIDYKKKIDYLVGLSLHNDIGFQAEIAIRIGKDKGPTAFSSFNMYFYTSNGQFPMERVRNIRNSHLPEGEYVDPDTLFERVKRGEIT